MALILSQKQLMTTILLAFWMSSHVTAGYGGGSRRERGRTTKPQLQTKNEEPRYLTGVNPEDLNSTGPGWS